MSTTPSRPRIEPLKIDQLYVILDHELKVAYSLTDKLLAGVTLMLAKSDPDMIYRSMIDKAPHTRELYAAIEAERASGELTPTDGTADTEEGDNK